MGHPAKEIEAEVPARRRALLIAVLSVGAGLAFATCSVPDGLYFKCELDGGCPQEGYVCTSDNHCVPPRLLDAGGGPVDAGCDLVPLEASWADTYPLTL